MKVNPNKFDVETLLYVLRRDKKKIERIEELLKMNKEINTAKKQRLDDEKKWFKK